MDTNIKPELKSLAVELQALESETFEIQDYTEVSELLNAPAAEAAADSTSTSSTSTCSSTTSTTSCCA